MPLETAEVPVGWSAALDLGFARRGERTVLARRAHAGPLHVQKALYPEGESVCHAIVVHPPAGIAGGDVLAVEVEVASGAHALLTTPGATKWYRSNGPQARQTIAIRAWPGSIVEWLPQEAIVFAGACASMSLEVSLDRASVLIAAEVLCLGRPACGERFDRGELRVSTEITREGKLQWIERGVLRGDDPLLASPIGFAGQPVVGSFIASAPGLGEAVRDACRAEGPAAGRGAVTLLPDLLVARYLGPRCEAAREWIARLWHHVRPVVTGRAAVAPRIWST